MLVDSRALGPMRPHRFAHWVAALLVFLHALAPGFHALQLRFEQQQRHVVRSCCFAGNLLGGGDRRAPQEVGLPHAQLLPCAIGTILLAGHAYASPALPRIARPTPERSSSTTTTPEIERDRRPATPPARGPPA